MPQRSAVIASLTRDVGISQVPAVQCHLHEKTISKLLCKTPLSALRLLLLMTGPAGGTSRLDEGSSGCPSADLLGIAAGGEDGTVRDVCSVSAALSISGCVTRRNPSDDNNLPGGRTFRQCFIFTWPERIAFWSRTSTQDN